jgi:hypothetical protein
MTVTKGVDLIVWGIDDNLARHRIVNVPRGTMGITIRMTSGSFAEVQVDFPEYSEFFHVMKLEGERVGEYQLLDRHAKTVTYI